MRACRRLTAAAGAATAPVMSLPEPIQGLDEIADRYDVVLSDVWGVIHNGRESFAPACQALAAQSPDPAVLSLTLTMAEGRMSFGPFPLGPAPLMVPPSG